MRKEANPTVSIRLKLKTKAAAYKWAQRWRQAWRVSSGDLHARKVLTPAEMRAKVRELRSVANRSLPITAPKLMLQLPSPQRPHVKDATSAVLVQEHQPCALFKKKGGRKADLILVPR